MLKTYKIKSVFGPTIQGEATHTGLPVKFIRFSGCNRWSGKPQDKSKAICVFCDTDFYDGQDMTSNEILLALAKLGPVKNVVISGGEPTLQLDHELLRLLKDNNYLIHLETNGSNNIDSYFHLLDHVTMSPKQPLQKTKLKKCHDLKVLYPEQIKDVTPGNFKDFDCKQKWIQPIDEEAKNNTSEALAFVINNPDWKLSIQTHKLIGAP